jgi:hypothetical protein
MFNSRIQKTGKNVAALFFFSLVASFAIAQEEPREISTTSFTFQVNGVAAKLNHFSSPAVDQKNEKIDRLVIVVHGTNRNPYTYHKNMRIAAEKAGKSETTLVVSPGFIMESDLDKNKDLLGDDHIFWTNSGWKQGDESVTNSSSNKRTVSLSSFAVVDKIILQILNSGNFPNIKHVVVSGNSAGGQLVNRYSGGNWIHDQVKKQFGIEMKYLVAAPSTYTYLTAERPVIGSKGKFYTPDANSCEGTYNHYRHGIEKFNSYMDKVSAEEYRARFATRIVAYFVGISDSDPKDLNLDVTCQAMLQGRERKERAEYFVDYLQHLYGKRYPLTVVPDAGHDHAKMFASPEGMAWLFK